MFTFGCQALPFVAVAPDAAEPVRFAADELRRYLALLLGAPLPAEGRAGAPRIELGVVPDAALGDEGYDLVSDGPVFRLVAGGPAGAVYGAYEFLRRYGGCQFSGLGPEGEHVPRRERVEIPEGRLRRKPQLWYRGLQAYGRTPANPDLDIQRFDWMAKNGMNYVMVTPVPDVPDYRGERSVDPHTGRAIDPAPADRYTNGWFREHWLPEIRKRGLKVDMNHHNLFYWLPPDVYFRDHPEWYALVNGERTRQAGQLCLCTSNADAVATLIENVKAYLRANPEVKLVGVIPEDGGGYCLCDACRREDASPDDVFRIGGPLRVRDSEAENPSIVRRYARLVNRVAAAVRDEFPDVRIGSAHYASLVFAPRGIRLEPNVVPWIAMYWRCGAHALTDARCPTNDFFLYELKKWIRAHGGQVILYEYYMGMSAQISAPYPMADVICREWPALKAMGIGGATVQSGSGSHNTYALNYLAFARHGWDDAVDYGRLRDDFLLGLYGSCAAAVRPIYDQLTEGRKRGPAAPDGADGPTCLFPDAGNMTTLVGAAGFDPIKRCLAAAHAQAASARESLQVRRLADAVRYWQALYEAAPLRAEIGRLEERIERLASAAWVRLDEGVNGIEALERAGWMNTGGCTAARWMNEMRAKSSIRALLGSDKIVFQAVASGPATVTVTRDGVREQPAVLAAGRVFRAYAKTTLRIEVDPTSAVSLSINGVACEEAVRCHRKRVTLDLDWRAHPTQPGRRKVFCTVR